MGLFGGSSREREESLIAIFDIGSGSVGTALVYLSKSHIPNILWSTRIPISFQKTPDFNLLTKTMLSTLLDSVLELQSKGLPMLKQISGPKRLTDVMYVFASPWYSIQTKVFTVNEEKPHALTEQFIHNLLKQEQDEFYAAVPKKQTKVGAADFSPVLIEEQVIQTALNGYIVSNPFGKPVREAQIDMVLSTVPEYIHKKVDEITTQLLGRKGKGMVKSFLLAAFTVIRDIFHGNKSFLLLDIRAEITDIITVHRGTIINATSFPYGKNHLIREVAERSNTVTGEAASVLATYLSGNSTIEQAERIRNILRDAQSKWTSSFVETAAKIATEVPLPRNIYITTDNEYGQWFKQAITAGDYSDYALTKVPFKTTILSARLLENYCSYNRLTSGTDPFLAIEAVYLEKLLYT